jgi:hypothetical protein
MYLQGRGAVCSPDANLITGYLLNAPAAGQRYLNKTAVLFLEAASSVHAAWAGSAVLNGAGSGIALGREVLLSGQRGNLPRPRAGRLSPAI